MAIGYINAMTSLIIITFLIPLVFGNIKRNLWYGIRLINAIKSDEAWLIVIRKCAIFGIFAFAAYGIYSLINAGGKVNKGVVVVIPLIITCGIWVAYCLFVDSSCKDKTNP